MAFDYVTEDWLDTASEEELSETLDEMDSVLEELDYDSDEHTNLFWLRGDVVHAIDSRFRYPTNIPAREHGWNLYKDE